LFAESGDELEAAAGSDVESRRRGAGSRRQVEQNDVSHSPSGLVGRRTLPAPPTDGDAPPASATTTTSVQRRHDAKSTTNGDDDGWDFGAFLVDYDAPPSRRDPRGADAATSEWSAETRSLMESKLRRSDSQDDESTAAWLAPAAQKNATTTTSRAPALADVTPNGARTTRPVVVGGSGQQLTTTSRFVPISNGVTTKADRLSAGLPAVAGRTRVRGPAPGAPSAGGSRSARTTPQGPSSPTKDVRRTRVRSSSDARDEYDGATTTAGARTGARVSAGDVTRRHRARNDVTTDSAARQPGGRSTGARQGPGPPPAPTSSRLRSSSQKRPGEMGGGVARQQPASRTTHDATRSQYR